MTIYFYRAVSIDGEIRKGVVEVNSLYEVGPMLSNRNLQLIRARPARALTVPFFLSKVKVQDLIELTVHLEQMERASIPLHESLRTLGNSHSCLRNVAFGLAQDMERGQLLSQALKQYPDIFDKVFVGFILMGENTGQLVDSLSQIHTHLVWTQTLKDQINKAIRYPLLMITLLLFAMGILMIVMVPQLASFLYTLGQELPWSTQCLISISRFLEYYWVWVLTGSVGLLFFGWLGFRTSSVPMRRLFAQIAFYLPFIGSFQVDIALARYFHHLGHMCAHNIGLLQALEAAKTATHSPVLQGEVQSIMSSITKGKKISETFQSVRVFPEIVVRMIEVGENSGQLPTTLSYLKEHFDRKVHIKLEKFITYIEPVLIVIVGLFLVLIVYSVFWPLYETLTLVDI